MTPFWETLKLTMVGVMLALESFSRVEVTAFFTAQGPVSISVGTVLRKRKLLAVGDKHKVDR